jgi:hypothetical protein
MLMCDFLHILFCRDSLRLLLVAGSKQVQSCLHEFLDFHAIMNTSGRPLVPSKDMSRKTFPILQYRTW